MKPAGTLLAILATLAWPAAHAVNKCTGPDGQISYQEAACSPSSKDSKNLAIRESGSATKSVPGSWRFTRSNDEMTGKVSCIVSSPITYPNNKVASKGFYPVNVAILFKTDGSVFGLKTSENTFSFHNELAGMGVKTDNSTFIPLSVKAGGSVVSVSDSEALIGLLANAQNLQVRVRVWPYDQLYDMVPLSMSGYTSAASQAMACANATTKAP